MNRTKIKVARALLKSQLPLSEIVINDSSSLISRRLQPVNPRRCMSGSPVQRPFQNFATTSQSWCRCKMSVPQLVQRLSQSHNSNYLTSHQRTTDDQLTEEEQRVLDELEREETLYKNRTASRSRQQQVIDGDLYGKDEDDASLKLQESISEAYVPFENQQRIIQDVIDEIWNPQTVDNSHVVYQPSPEFLKRGKTGVFDMPELVELLRKEKCDEVVTITIPKEVDYADHMIIVTCRSPQHLLAMATYVRKRFKMKSLKRTDLIPHIVSQNGVQGWIALDLGNIVLHLFLQAQRDHFDLEMLWTVGPMFDDLYNTRDPDIIQLLNMIK